ncbi:hypothetical protein [Acanthopleuribacter pedis]|uniref:Uncharacterized protein n=1 Tax=Acanthopleuribacter pedis TaxID=442870 RepID=A0A8J7QBD9_9BACT|nr:hypothetical protein [Acanthopleuribacter pedis]MBO1321342.1 hypothetical protein [Acanthopleuribacter pedis]
MDDLIPLFIFFVTPVTLTLLYMGYRLANRLLDLRMAKLNPGSESAPLEPGEPPTLNPRPLQERAQRLQERLGHLEEILAHQTKQGKIS